MHGPLVLLNTNGFYDRLLELLEQMAEQGFMSKNCLVLVRVCATPEDALEAAHRAEKAKGSIRRLEDYIG